MFLISLMGDPEYIYTGGTRRESTWKYRRERECQEHIVPRLVVGTHNN